MDPMNCKHGRSIVGDCRECNAEMDAAEVAKGAPLWVVNNLGELGVKIGERLFFLYKGRSIEYGPKDMEGDEPPMMWRTVGKREFGECCHPINYADLTKIGTVSLSDSNRWQPFPTKP